MPAWRASAPTVPTSCSGWLPWKPRRAEQSGRSWWPKPLEIAGRYARVDPETLEAKYAHGLDDLAFMDFQLVAVIGEDTLIGIYKRRQVVRMSLSKRTVLWPR